VISSEPPRQVEAPHLRTPTNGKFEAFELLWQRRAVIAKSAALGFIVALSVAFLIPKQYESTTRLMPPDSQALSSTSAVAAVVGSLPAGAADLAGNLFGSKVTGATFVGVLQSRTVQDDLINHFDLRKIYGLKRYVDTRKKLSSRTDIAEDAKSGIITISVIDNDPTRARDLAAGYVDDLNRLLSQLSSSAARRERIFLEERLQKVKQDLDEATLRLGTFSSQNMAFDPQLQGKALLDAASALQGQLIAAESELSGLEQVYGPENSRVRIARARVGELRSKLRGISGRTVPGKGNTSSVASELYPSLEQLPLLGNTYGDLARRAKIDESIFEVLTKQYELAKVQEAKEIPTIKVLDAANVPERKSFPPRLIIALLAALLSAVTAAMWSIVRVKWADISDSDRRKRLLHTVAIDLRLIKRPHLSQGPIEP